MSFSLLRPLADALRRTSQSWASYKPSCAAREVSVELIFQASLMLGLTHSATSFNAFALDLFTFFAAAASFAALAAIKSAYRSRIVCASARSI